MSASVTVVYPNQPGARFDAAYYAATHVPLATEIWQPARCEVIEALPMGDAPPPFALIATFHFASMEALGQAMANPRVPELQADVANFTDITPVIMMGRPLV